MVLQKAMEQGRNVYGIPLLDACSDHNNIITSRMCGHVGGHAYSVSVSKWLLDCHIQYPNLRHICRVHIRGWERSVQQNILTSWRLYSHSHFCLFSSTIHLVSPSQHSAPHSIENNGGGGGGGAAWAERRAKWSRHAPQRGHASMYGQNMHQVMKYHKHSYLVSLLAQFLYILGGFLGEFSLVHVIIPTFWCVDVHGVLVLK